MNAGTLVGQQTATPVLNHSRVFSERVRPHMKPSRDTINTSLLSQVQRQLQNGYARYITNGIYRFTLSKQGEEYMTKYQLDEQLAPTYKSTNIQYIEQTRGNIVINIKVR